MFAHRSSRSECVPDGNTGKIKAAGKGTGLPTLYADGPGKVSSLTGTPLHMKVYGTTFIRRKVTCNWEMVRN